jgi:hypothetical protein
MNCGKLEMLISSNTFKQGESVKRWIIYWAGFQNFLTIGANNNSQVADWGKDRNIGMPLVL